MIGNCNIPNADTFEGKGPPQYKNYILFLTEKTITERKKDRLQDTKFPNLKDLKNYPGKEREHVTILSYTGPPKPARSNPSGPYNQIPTMWPDVNSTFVHSFTWDVCDKVETENEHQCEQAQPARLKNNGVLEAAALSPERALSQKGPSERVQRQRTESNDLDYRRNICTGFINFLRRQRAAVHLN